MKKTALKLTCILALLAGLLGCGKESAQSCEVEGERLLRQVAKDLSEVDCRDDLLRRAERLQKEFEALVDILIKLRSFQDSDPGSMSEVEESEGASSLRAELNRVARLEGVLDLLAEIQDSALQRLDLHHQGRLKRQSRRK